MAPDLNKGLTFLPSISTFDAKEATNSHSLSNPTTVHVVHNVQFEQVRECWAWFARILFPYWRVEVAQVGHKRMTRPSTLR